MTTRHQARRTAGGLRNAGAAQAPRKTASSPVAPALGLAPGVARERAKLATDIATPAPDVDRKLDAYLTRWREVTARLAEADARAAEWRAALADVEENLLPNLLAEVGVEALRAPDGTTVAVKPVITAAVSKRNEAEAEAILTRIGEAGVMTTTVAFTFAHGADGQVKKLLKVSRELEVPCDVRSGVNTATLKAVVARALADGKLQPADLEPLGVFLVTKAVVKPPKEKL